MKYRAEIDGLRAVAVIPVILFHAGFQLFSGGYVGVDVFFVISGYLITTIIVNQMEEGNFSLANFYMRRARRILPVLFFIVLVCVPFAWMWLMPRDMKDFAQSLVAVSTFSSNILFWQQSGYFDTAAELKPLIHTWSLAVEEQYYILYPLFLMLAWRFGKKAILSTLALLFVISLGVAHWGAYNHPTAAFFLLPTRGWEILLGALCAFYLKRKESDKPGLSQIASIVGLALIAFAVFLFDKNTPTPSLYTFIPTIGTALIILFSVQGTFVTILLSNKAFVGIGLISYSAYLWHQPLFAFARHRSLEEPSEPIMLLLAILSVVLAFFTWKYIENPFRRGTIKIFDGRRNVFMLSSTVGLVIIFIGLLGVHSDGFFHRFSEEYEQIISAENDRSSKRETLGYSAANPRFVLIGDSHANSLQDAFHNGLGQRRLQMLVETMNGCPPVYGLYRHDLDFGDKCDRHYREVYKRILENKNLEAVVVLARYTLYLESYKFDNGEGGVEKGVSDMVIYDSMAFKDRIRSTSDRKLAIYETISSGLIELAEQGKKVLIIGPIPEVGWNVPKIAFSYKVKGFDSEVVTGRNRYEQRNAVTISMLDAVSEHPNISVIYPHDTICNQLECRATEGGIPLYYDTTHLTNSAAAWFIKTSGLIDYLEQF